MIINNVMSPGKLCGMNNVVMVNVRRRKSSQVICARDDDVARTPSVAKSQSVYKHISRGEVLDFRLPKNKRFLRISFEKKRIEMLVQAF